MSRTAKTTRRERIKMGSLQSLVAGTAQTIGALFICQYQKDIHQTHGMAGDVAKAMSPAVKMCHRPLVVCLTQHSRQKPSVGTCQTV